MHHILTFLPEGYSIYVHVPVANDVRRFVTIRAHVPQM